MFFFNVCAAVASDLIFDYKIGEFCQLKRFQVHIAQWIGLLATAFSIGIVLYLFFNSFALGSADFFGYRSQSKALLVQTLNFNYSVVFFGFLYGLMLKKFNLSPTMTFGGILMPNNISIGLLIGAIISFFVHFRGQKEDYIPFCSGIFASESLWIIISAASKTLLKL